MINRRIRGFAVKDDGYVPIPEDEERGADWFQYQLQCAFEDLCGLVGFDKALLAMMTIAREHQEMLKRQGKR